MWDEPKDNDHQMGKGTSLKTPNSPCTDTFVKPLVPKTPRTPCVTKSQDSSLISKSPLRDKEPESKVLHHVTLTALMHGSIAAFSLDISKFTINL